MLGLSISAVLCAAALRTVYTAPPNCPTGRVYAVSALLGLAMASARYL